MTHSTMPAPGNDVFPPCRSILFVPGDRPDRYGRALAAGADAVCIDLEDAVAPARKDVARDAVARFLAGRVAGSSAGRGAGSPSPVALIVRVNDMTTREGERDAAALAKCPPPAGFMIPKVATAAQVKEAARALGQDAAEGEAAPGEATALEAAATLERSAALLPLIETAHGLENAAVIAARAGVAGLVFGGFDLAIELGAEPEWEPLLYARSRMVHAAALGEVQAIDMPSRDFRDLGVLREEAARARRLGFTGKTAIHPAQIPVINEVFSPSEEEVRRARDIVEADRTAGGGAVALDGRMVDRPVVEAARRTMRRARLSPRAPGASAGASEPHPEPPTPPHPE